MGELKRIQVTDNSFTANGRKYLIQYDQISVGRYMIYEKKSVELGFGVSYFDIFDTIKQIEQSLTSGNDVMKGIDKAVVLARNQMAAIAEQGNEAIPRQLVYCTLFCNREDEDLTSWNMNLALDKIEDWKKEGIVASDFFQLATSMIVGYYESLNHILKEGIANQIKSPDSMTPIDTIAIMTEKDVVQP